MPSEDEKSFAKIRSQIHLAIQTCFSVAEMLLELNVTAGGWHLDALGGSIQPNSLAAQRDVLDRTYRSRQGAAESRIEVVIQPTGSAWTPVVTITTSDTDPQQIIFDAEFQESLGRLLRVLCDHLRRLSR